MPKCMPERDRTCFWLAGRLAGGWLHANLRTENSKSQSVDLEGGGAHRMRTRGASPSASEVSDMPALGGAPAVAVALLIF
eukprot:COSAG01_NODE_735_length_13969_cov_357.018241_14_plen_80_part_00